MFIFDSVKGIVDEVSRELRIGFTSMKESISEGFYTAVTLSKTFSVFATSTAVAYFMVDITFFNKVLNLLVVHGMMLIRAGTLYKKLG